MSWLISPVPVYWNTEELMRVTIWSAVTWFLAEEWSTTRSTMFTWSSRSTVVTSPPARSVTVAAVT